jgi:DnaA family protein
VNLQLPLNLSLRDDSSFDNFIGARNREAVEQVERAVALAAGPVTTLTAVFLWGEAGSGKTHVLEAACRRAQMLDLAPAFMPLREVRSLSVEVLDGLEQARLVVLDDLQTVAGDAIWERAVFGLYERLRAVGGALLLAGDAAPMRLGVRLPDLATRLGAGLVYQLHALADEDKLVALCHRANNRGIHLSGEVARYVLARYPRDMHALFALLDRIDRASLSAQRRVTIPWVRSLLSDGA